MNREIPIFFSTDDCYVPYLDVAISSLIANASKAYSYRIVVLNTGLSPENVATVKRRECEGFTIDFTDISEHVKTIKSHFKNVYHFSVATYYRLFIASLFPQYDKIVYLDCDLVVLGDVSKLYHTDMGDNVLAAAPEQYMPTTRAFRRYARLAVGVSPDRYINAGVLVINLKAFRENGIEERFVDLITRYDFDLLDPDQAYLNYLCRDKIHYLPNGWNKYPTEMPCDGEKHIVHYALYKKPWQYADMTDGDLFWSYAERSPFYERIKQTLAAFGDEQRAQKEAAAAEILAHAETIIASDNTFVKMGGTNYATIAPQGGTVAAHCRLGATRFVAS